MAEVGIAVGSGEAIGAAAGAGVLVAEAVGDGVVVTAFAAPVRVEAAKATPVAAKIPAVPITTRRLAMRGMPLPDLCAPSTDGLL